MDWDDEDEKTTVFDRSNEESARALLSRAPSTGGASGPTKTRTPVPTSTPGSGSFPHSPPPALSQPRSSAPSGPGAPPRPPANVPPRPPSSLPSAAPPLPAGSGAPSFGSAPPPRAPLSQAPPAPPQVASRAPQFASPPAANQALGSEQAASAQVHIPPMPSAPSFGAPAANTNKALIYGGAGLAAALVLGYFFASGPSTGSLAVSVSGPGGKAITGVVVTVDGEEVCKEALCQVPDLEKGSHQVAARAQGFEESAAKLVSIREGEEAVLNIELSPANAGTGVEVSAKAPGLTLSIDGKTIGKLPQEITGLEPGDHEIEIGGSKLFKPFKETVTLQAGKVLQFEPQLELEQGQLTINLGKNAREAKIRLEGGGKTFVLHGKEFPLTINIPADKTFTLTATRDGYDDFEEDIEFSVEKPQRTVDIDLEEGSDADESSSAATSRSRSSSSSSSTRTSAASRAPSGTAKLNINSIPVSSVILDGRPIGTTPKIGLTVSAGTHTIVFVHPEKGRQVKTLTVTPGGTGTAAVRF